MKKNFSIIIIMMIFLGACGKTENIPTENPKTPFIINTKKLQDFHTEISGSKSAVIQSSSTLDIIAETSGKVTKILTNEGQSVPAGKILVSLSDSQNNFDLALLQAKNNITLQDASAETQIANLDNAIATAEFQYARALEAYEQFLGKNNLKYDNLREENKNTLKTYNDTYKNFLTSLDASITSHLYDADKIIGVTSKNEHANNAWESYLGVRTGKGLAEAQNEWNKLYASRGEIRARLESGKIFPSENQDADMELLTKAFERERILADTMSEMIRGSVVGAGLSVEMQNGWIAQWNAIRNSVQQAETSFISWKNQTKNFLENYEKNELATKIATNSLGGPISAEDFNALQENPELKLAYDNASLSLREASQNAKISLEQAKSALENAKNLKSATLKQISASKQGAELSLAQAERNAGKLNIKAPINGTITKIHAEVGEQISAGKIIAEMSGNNTQATIEIHPRTALFLEVGQNVEAKVGEKILEGKIASISRIAGKNMLSTVRISFENAENFIGQSAEIFFQIPENISQTFLLPINAVKIIAEGEGEIQTLVDGKIFPEKVRLGAMYGTSVEIFTEIPENTEIIISDVSRFNSENQTLQIEKNS